MQPHAKYFLPLQLLMKALRKLLEHLHFRKIWLIVAPLILCVTDAAVTLMGQPDRYWSDGFSSPNEANPVAGLALAISPVHFVLERTIYILFWCILVLLAPARIAFVISLWVAIAHTVGTFSWIYTVFRWSYTQVSIYFFFVSLMISVCWFCSGYFQPELRTSLTKQHKRLG